MVMSIAVSIKHCTIWCCNCLTSSTKNDSPEAAANMQSRRFGPSVKRLTYSSPMQCYGICYGHISISLCWHVQFIWQTEGIYARCTWPRGGQKNIRLLCAWYRKLTYVIHRQAVYKLSLHIVTLIRLHLPYECKHHILILVPGLYTSVCRL